jgi:hypothetical protein
MVRVVASSRLWGAVDLFGKVSDFGILDPGSIGVVVEVPQQQNLDQPREIVVGQHIRGGRFVVEHPAWPQPRMVCENVRAEINKHDHAKSLRSSLENLANYLQSRSPD